MPLVALLGNMTPQPVDGAAMPAVPTDPSASFTNALSSAMSGGQATPVPGTPPAVALPQAMVATMGSRQPARVRQGEGAPSRGASEQHATPIALALRNGTITRDQLMALVGRQDGTHRNDQPVDRTGLDLDAASMPDAEWIATAFGANEVGVTAANESVSEVPATGMSTGDTSVPVPSDVPAIAPATGSSVDMLTAFIAAVPGQPVELTDALAGLTGSAPSTGTPTSSTASTLHPLFRDRLERVIERMESEFGYNVEVVETLRSQERQDALFKQGRTAPGPVVTWTRNSHHTTGLAADVMVDGTYNNPIAYNRLARVAREEGLRTLGPQDKGHIELPRTALAPGDAMLGALDADGTSHTFPTRNEAFARARAMQPSSGMTTLPVMPAEPIAAPGGVARVASVARVAQVASVARVANVAQVGGGSAPVPPRESASVVASAMPAGKTESAPVVASMTPQPTRERNVPAAVTPPGLVMQPREARPVTVTDRAPVVESGEPGEPSSRVETRPAVPDHVTTAMPSPETRGDTSRGDSQRKDREREPVAVAQPNVHEALDASLLRAFNGERTTDFIGRAERSETLVGTSAMDRVAELTELRDAAAERPMSSVLLRLDRPDGTEDRIRIGLRGNGVGAAFEMSDAGMADDLGRHLADLARSMERQGLDPESMTVRTLSAKDAPVGASQAAAGERDALRAAAAGSASNGNAAGREGRGQASRQDHPHDESPRQRPRRDSRGDR